MANLKAIRKRIGSVKSTQKITRAMKMVAAARLSKAQIAITELRPYALKTMDVLSSVAGRTDDSHPLLQTRPQKRVMLVILTSDRGLAGAFNASVCKTGMAKWKALEAEGVEVSFAVIGRKGRDFFRRRGATIRRDFTGVFENLSVDRAGEIGRYIIGQYTAGGIRRIDAEFRSGEATDGIITEDAVTQGATLEDQLEGEDLPPPDEDAEAELDAVYLVYNEFKSAIAQDVLVETLLPITPVEANEDEPAAVDFLYEPSQRALLDHLLPMYVSTEVYRALLESVASEHGARMTAMDNATKNAADMIDKLTLKYNRARQAAITTELMEIIGGAEALKG